MATYKGIQGYSVQNLSSDPTLEDTIGQLWYASDTGKFKISTQSAGAWSSGGDYALGVTQGMVSAGTQTAALGAQGLSQPAYIDESYEYDGTSWATAVIMNRPPGAYTQGFGTQTACVAGGFYSGPAAAVTDVAEDYNGSTWTTINSCVNALGNRSGCGTSTAGLEAGGSTVSPESAGLTATVEEFNGTSWADGTAMNTARIYIGQHNGTQTACLSVSGWDGSVLTIVEEWNGTSWTEIAEVNTGRKWGGGNGTTALSLYWGGAPPINGTSITESWDGTSWTEVGDLATARGGGGSAGTTNTSALCITGGMNSYDPETEEFNDPVYAIKTVTVS